MKSKIALFLIGILLIFSGKIYALDCTPLDPREGKVSEETEAEIKGSAQTLFKVGRVEGDMNYQTKKEVTSLYKNHPNYDKIIIKSKLIYFYCTILNDSNLPIDKQIKMLQDLTEALELPTSSSTGVSESEVKSFAEQWVGTVKMRSAEQLLSISDLPFYFDDHFVFTSSELRKEYLEFLGIQYFPPDEDTVGMWTNFGNPSLSGKTEVIGITVRKLGLLPQLYVKEEQVIETLKLNSESPVAIISLIEDFGFKHAFVLFVHKEKHKYKAIGACQLVPPI